VNKHWRAWREDGLMVLADGRIVVKRPQALQALLQSG
jgi:hypothetical protein